MIAIRCDQGLFNIVTLSHSCDHDIPFILNIKKPLFLGKKKGLFDWLLLSFKLSFCDHVYQSPSLRLRNWRTFTNSY